MRDHVEHLVLHIDQRTLANIITRHLGITDDGLLAVDHIGPIDNPPDQGYQITMRRRPLEQGRQDER